MKPKRVAVSGYRYFVAMLSKILSRDGWQAKRCPRGSVVSKLITAYTIWQADVLYLVGGVTRMDRRLDLARLFRKPVFMHWVGSDVLEAIENFKAGLVDEWVVNQVVHWAEVPWTAEELRQAGIEASVMSLASATVPTEHPPSLPNDFTVLTYLPDGWWDFFQGEEILRLATDFSNIQFRIVACSESPGKVPPNVRLLGYVHDMSQVYPEVTLYVRLAHHDGLSFMVLESLAYGRHVIWSYPFKGVISVGGYEELKQAVNILLHAHCNGKLELNREGRAYVLESYSPDKVAQRILAEFSKYV